MYISMPTWLFAVLCVALVSAGFLSGVFWRVMCRLLDYDEKELFGEDNGEV